MTQFIAFPKIKQFKDCVHNVRHKTRFTGLDEETGEPIYDHLAPLPRLKFRGTVKLHGTNAAVVLHPDWTDENIVAQSRSRICTVLNDNAGFAAFVHGREIPFEKLFARVFLSVERKGNKIGDNPVAIYGEWCGSNIQGGVGLSELASKMFVIFAVRIGAEDETRWLELDPSLSDPENGIYNILDYPYWDMTVDFEQPAFARNIMVDLTLSVEEECPVAKAHGVEKGTGEGVVWKCVESGFEDSGFWFKVKGEKHSVSKVKTLSPVDPEMMKNAQEFVESNVTENRCLQGIQTLQEMGAELSMKSTGIFLKWIFEDIISEEKDTLTASSLDAKTVSKPISEKARKWYFKFLKENV